MQPPGGDPTRRLIRLALGGLPDVPLRLAHAAAAVVGLSQVHFYFYAHRQEFVAAPLLHLSFLHIHDTAAVIGSAVLGVS